MSDTYHWIIDGDAPFLALERIVDLLWEGVVRDYKKNPSPEHFFNALVEVANWFNSSGNWTVEQYVIAWENVPQHGWRAGGMYYWPANPSEPSKEGCQPG